jgi:hypothetical protein
VAADIVSLRRARKTRDRALREADAAANRIKHGTPPALRRADAAERSLAERRFEGHRLEGAPDAAPRGDREP